MNLELHRRLTRIQDEYLERKGKESREARIARKEAIEAAREAERQRYLKETGHDINTTEGMFHYQYGYLFKELSTQKESALSNLIVKDVNWKGKEITLVPEKEATAITLDDLNNTKKMLDAMKPQPFYIRYDDDLTKLTLKERVELAEEARKRWEK